MKSFWIDLAVIAFLAVASTCSAQITFAPNVIDYVPGRVSGIYAGDIDRDGDNDIVATSKATNTVLWWRNDGGSPPQWTRQTIDSMFGGAMYVWVADINGDSINDVIASAVNTGEIAWWKNDGSVPVRWTKQTIGTGFGTAHGVCAADIDGDGRKDVLGTSESLNKISWWRNGGSPIIWTEYTIDNNFSGTQSVCAVDIDRDGDIDVLGAAGGNNQIGLWRNDGGNPVVWTKQIISNTFAFAHWVSVADVDGDSLQDVLGAAFSSNEIAWWRNNGGTPISWTKQVIGGAFNGALTVQAADFDGDGRTDVLGSAWTADQIAWWSNDGGNPIQWTKHVIDNNYDGAWPVFACDLDGDSDIDVMAGADVLNGSGVSAPPTWWENTRSTGVMESPRDGRPSKVLLHQNYPNPFNPSTTISYALPNTSFVTLSVCNTLGQQVAQLVSEQQQAGYHEAAFLGDGLANGVYFYKLDAGRATSVKKLLLLK